MLDLNPAQLSLEDGTKFSGWTSLLKNQSVSGEVVFTTSIVGYPETLTDPSFTGQILVFSYPMIGNYGIPDSSNWESLKPSVAGVVVNYLCTQASHRNAQESFFKFCEYHSIPIIMGVDTRALTKYLRNQGTALGTIESVGATKTVFSKLTPQEIIARVARKEIEVYDKQEAYTIVLVDCGAKASILRHLLNLPVNVKVVPYNYDYTETDYDGVLVSNGPGNPQDWSETIAILKKSLQKKKPFFGICLGSQLLALAIGASTYKMKFGHRGINQPCYNELTKRSFLTSQNHGYAVLEESLPEDWGVLFRNLNDSTIEGIFHKKDPFFSVQFHPESCPGPDDCASLFQSFYELLTREKVCQEIF